MGENSLSEKELEELQKETLQMIGEYLDKLIPGMNTVVSELSGNEKEDTWEYLRMILDGFNWVCEAYNGTCGYISRNGGTFDNASIDENIKKLNSAYKSKDKDIVAAQLKDAILPFLSQLKEYIAKI